MARPSRINLPGAFYHVMLRGNNGDQIFFNDRDRCKMCLLIQEGIEKFGHRIHAFCFMSNHVHLLFQASEHSISKIFHHLSFRYSQYINKVYQRKGHVFQGRFKAVLIDEEGYYFKLLRYIHLNPIRAGMVDKLSDYKWSSHRTFLGQQDICWLTTNYALEQFHPELNEARLAYSKYVSKIETNEETEELKKGFKQGVFLGKDKFRDTMTEKYRKSHICLLPAPKVSIEEIADAACEVFEIKKDQLISTEKSIKATLVRGVVAAYAYDKGLTIEEVADALKRESSTLSRSRTKFLAQLRDCVATRNQYERVKTRLLKDF